MTFDHYANLYLKFKKNELKNSTFEKYESIIELRLLPFFQNIPITEIKTSDIKLWLLNIDDVGGKSKRTYMGVIKGIFDEALYDELIEKIPFLGYDCQKSQSRSSIPLPRTRLKAFFKLPKW
jgi:integrase